jgi:hypothetical protein
MIFFATRFRSWLAHLNEQRAFRRIWLCAGVYVLLVLWLRAWPYTGEGDSILHYWNLRTAWIDPRLGLTVWARPLYVLLMIVPAQFGLYAVRCWAALIAVLLTWQTMRMADDLRLPNATMAGVFLIFQPLTFALASDTMTEIPMALGLAIALRLWWARHYLASCLLVSFLPLVRPEGFLLAPVWGLFLLALPRTSEYPSWPQRLLIGSSLATGMLCLFAVSRVLTGEWIYYVSEWSWPLVGSTKGRLWHHVVHWPYYCGWVLLPLFLLGVIASIKRVMALPWAAWAVVFIAHSLMFWTGTFSALGLMRILVTTAPVTALICLYAWNALAKLLRAEHWPRLLRVCATSIVALSAMATAMIYYYEEPLHHRFVLARKAATFVRQNHLFDEAPRIFATDPIVLAELDIPVRQYMFSTTNPELAPFRDWVVVRHIVGREKSVAQMRTLPPGSVGVWDDDLGRWWYHILPEEFPALGYEVLYRVKQTEQDITLNWNEWVKKNLVETFITMKYGKAEQEYVVVRKPLEAEKER